MKKIFFALLAVVFAATLCFAQESEQSSTSASQPAPATSQVETKSFTGIVKSVSVGNADEGTKSQITVTDASGQDLTFTVESDVSISDNNGNTLAFSDIKNNSQITVKYITGSDGINKAEALIITQQQTGG